ncbi:eCIS core domain-containing protein [Brevibacillus dissolubilis]|uniref:eCIS core domain-containing protein n=1 Tax=Brevibacillus dissolubilis TaxID=1844116 RepID=UPI001116879E|nr:DUF4157 domain-containing protein [Brevibacillus dissolubilis]
MGDEHQTHPDHHNKPSTSKPLTKLTEQGQESQQGVSGYGIKQFFQDPAKAPSSVIPYMQKTLGNRALVQMMRNGERGKGNSDGKIMGSSNEHSNENGNQYGSRDSSTSPNANANGLPPVLQAQMEQSFQTDFSDVAITPNSSAAVGMGALAFAQGNQIHFAPGQFNPGTVQGKSLIGHELAHVVQQRRGRVAPTHRLGKASDQLINADPHLEREADEWGARAARGEQVIASAGAAPSTSSAGSDKTPILQGKFSTFTNTIRLRRTTPSPNANASSPSPNASSSPSTSDVSPASLKVRQIKLPHHLRPPTQFGEKQQAHSISWTLLTQSYEKVKDLQLDTFIREYLITDWQSLQKQTAYSKPNVGKEMLQHYLGQNQITESTLNEQTDPLSWHHKIQASISNMFCALQAAPLSTHTGFTQIKGDNGQFGVQESKPSGHGEADTNRVLKKIEEHLLNNNSDTIPNAVNDGFSQDLNDLTAVEKLGNQVLGFNAIRQLEKKAFAKKPQVDNLNNQPIKLDNSYNGLEKFKQFDLALMGEGQFDLLEKLDFDLQVLGADTDTFDQLEIDALLECENDLSHPDLRKVKHHAQYISSTVGRWKGSKYQDVKEAKDKTKKLWKQVKNLGQVKRFRRKLEELLKEYEGVNDINPIKNEADFLANELRNVRDVLPDIDNLDRLKKDLKTNDSSLKTDSAVGQKIQSDITKKSGLIHLYEAKLDLENRAFIKLGLKAFSEMDNSSPIQMNLRKDKLPNDETKYVVIRFIAHYAKKYWDPGIEMTGGISNPAQLAILREEYIKAFCRTYPTIWEQYGEDVLKTFMEEWQLPQDNSATVNSSSSSSMQTDPVPSLNQDFQALLELEAVQPNGGAVYQAADYMIESLKLSDDRPPTKAKKGQKSHTIAWTLMLHALRNMAAGKSLKQFLEAMYVKWLLLSYQDWSEEPSEINDYLDNIKQALNNGAKTDLTWQNFVQEMISQYVIIYQASPLATYNDGEARGHGEADAMKHLRDNEAKSAGERDIAELIHASAATLLDIKWTPFTKYSLETKKKYMSMIYYEWEESIREGFPQIWEDQKDQLRGISNEIELPVKAQVQQAEEKEDVEEEEIEDKTVMMEESEEEKEEKEEADVEMAASTSTTSGFGKPSRLEKKRTLREQKKRKRESGTYLKKPDMTEAMEAIRTHMIKIKESVSSSKFDEADLHKQSWKPDPDHSDEDEEDGKRKQQPLPSTLIKKVKPTPSETQQVTTPTQQETVHTEMTD